MSRIKRIAIAVVALCLLSAIACAEGWQTGYLAKLKAGTTRVIGLYDLTGDGIPELIDVTGGTFSIKSTVSGTVKNMKCKSYDFSANAIKGLRAVKLVSRTDSNGQSVLFIRMLGDTDDIRLAFSASGSESLDLRLNMRKSLGRNKTNYYVNSSAVTIEKYQNAIENFNSDCKKRANIQTRTLTARDSSASIKRKFKQLAKEFQSDAQPGAIKLSATNIKLAVGDTEKLTVSFSPSGTASEIEWSSNSAKVASVSASGEVTGLSKGSTFITATTQNGLVAKCAVAVSGTGKTPVIVDISQHNYSANMDWATIAKNVDLMILRCGVTRTYTEPIGVGIDGKFAYFAKMCRQYDIPFGVYFYGKCSSVAEAKQEAKLTWDTASEYNPLFYVYDAEESRLTKNTIETYMKTLQSLGAKKTGYYIAHHLYSTYSLDTSLVDFIWIPRYGGESPKYDCDIHQYTSTGKVAGFPGVVDVNRLTGSKPLSWFLK